MEETRVYFEMDDDVDVNEVCWTCKMVGGNQIVHKFKSSNLVTVRMKILQSTQRQ